MFCYTRTWLTVEEHDIIMNNYVKTPCLFRCVKLVLSRTKHVKGRFPNCCFEISVVYFHRVFENPTSYISEPKILSLIKPKTLFRFQRVGHYLFETLEICFATLLCRMQTMKNNLKHKDLQNLLLKSV